MVTNQLHSAFMVTLLCQLYLSSLVAQTLFVPSTVPFFLADDWLFRRALMASLVGNVTTASAWLISRLRLPLVFLSFLTGDWLVISNHPPSCDVIKWFLW